mgnify:CR=1 FL=1
MKKRVAIIGAGPAGMTAGYEISKNETLVVFKHSTRCGISRMVMKQFEDDYDTSLNIDLFYLDLLNLNYN